MSAAPTDFKVFNPTARPQPSLPALPDDYFNPSAADLKSAQAALSARSKALNDAPLQLRAVREADAKAKRDRWPETRIRVKFNDGTQLEKIFPSTSKIRAIYAFVRGCLREDVKPIKFVLYQPPKHELKVSDLKVRDLSLSELQLAPSSILLLRFEVDALNHVNVRAPLEASVLAQAVDLPAPPPPPADAPTSSSKPSTSTTQSSPSSGPVKVPKWLKLGKK